MMTEIFTVFDLATKAYMEPFFAPTVDFAIRSFSEACTTAGHQFAKYPADYALYHVGTFDMASGELQGFDARRVAVANAFTVAEDSSDG